MNEKDNSSIQKDTTKNTLGKIEDSRVFFVLKKTEKISSALFMITDVFNQSQDVLKKEIQEGTISLLKDISKISTNQISSKEAIDKIVQSFLYIKSLLDVAQKINCISENNQSILFKEINYCIERVNELKSNPLQLILNNELDTDDFFLINYDEDEYEEKENDSNSEERMLPYRSSYKGQVKDTKRTVVKKESNKTKRQGTNRSDDKRERQDRIKMILREGGEMNIKDIVNKCDGVSSKTIQRDLQEMISAKIVKKEGERRWSMYSII